RPQPASVATIAAHENNIARRECTRIGSSPADSHVRLRAGETIPGQRPLLLRARKRRLLARARRRGLESQAPWERKHSSPVVLRNLRSIETEPVGPSGLPERRNRRPRRRLG